MTRLGLFAVLSAARSLRAAAVALALTTIGVAASAQDPLHPAAQCAAVWFGSADFADGSPHLTANPADTEMAKAFRDVALRLIGDPVQVDSLIADQRPQMLRLVESYIYGDDQQSRDLFERLTARCHDLAGRHPETRDIN